LLELKYKKWFLLVAAIVVVFVFVVAYLFWWPAYVFGQKVDELKSAGATVVDQDYNAFQSEATNTNPNAVFTKKDDWSAFKQQVLDIKAQNGTVTVWVDSPARTMWFLGSAATYYYYQV